MRVTLDRNCLIDLEERRRPFDEAVEDLLRLAERDEVHLSIPASAASERPRPGANRVKNFAQFKRWVQSLGFTNVEYLAPILYLDVGFLGHAVLGGGKGQELENRIHDVVAPKLPRQAPETQEHGRWLNAKCDIQAIWCQVTYGTDILATRDKRLIRKLPNLAPLGAYLMQPADIVALMRHRGRDH